MKKKLLTIGIPTFNRKEPLEKSLEAIVKKVSGKKHEDEVEIIISDNASDDGTTEICEEYQKNYPDLIRYSRNDINLGLGKNLQAVCDIAKGEYIWMACDYCFNILPDTVDFIIQKLKTGKYDNLLINAEEDEKHTPCIKISQDVETNSLNEFFDITHNTCGICIVNIIKKDIYDIPVNNSDTWLHFDKLLNAPKNTKSYICAKPYMLFQGQKVNSWSSDEKALLYNLEIIHAIALSGIDSETKIKLLKIYKPHFTNFAFRARKNCKLNFKELAKKLTPAITYVDFSAEQKILNSFLHYFIHRIKRNLKKLFKSH